MSHKKNRIVFGPNRCISGDTVISGKKVRDIKEEFEVQSWDGRKLVKAKARKPFLKGRDHLYEYKFSNGAKIVCTKDHLIFTGKSYVSAGSLSLGDFALTPLSNDAFRFQTNLDNAPLVHALGGLRYTQKSPNFRFCYPVYSHLYDERPLLFGGNVLDAFPSRDGVLRYNGQSAFPYDGHWGDLVSKQGYNHSYLLTSLLSIPCVLHQNVGRFFDILSHSVDKLSQWFGSLLRVEIRSMLEFFHPESSFEFDSHPNLSSNDISYLTSITHKGYNDYYDFEVPIYHNYYAGGLIHHNSGKSILGASEIVMMASLRKHMFRKTLNPKNGMYRVYTEDFALLEKNIIPLMKEWIPVRSYKNSLDTTEASWEKSYDKLHHILKLKNATIDFMTYEQPLSKSESVSLDGVWGDEEMPEDVFVAVQARLISRNGRFWLTVTPLYRSGWTTWLQDGPETEVYRIGMYENQYIEKKAFDEFKESLKRFSEEEQQARLYGQHMEFKGVVYKELRSDVHLIEEDTKVKNYPVIFIMDPHPRKPTMMGWAYVTPQDDVVFFDELEMPGTAKEIVRAIRLREAEHKQRTMLRLIDPAAKKQGSFGFETDTLREFEKEGMGFTLADNSEAGYNVVHEYLTYDTSRPMSSLNRPRCFFTRNCSKIWDSMTHLMWDEWAHRNIMKDKKEKVKDFKKDGADLVRYCLSYKPTYRGFINLGPKSFSSIKSFSRI